MNHLHNDAVTCIIDKLEYLDLLNLSETCKRFESIRSFVIFRKKKNSFHDFNIKIIIGYGCNVLVMVDGHYVAHKFSVCEDKVAKIEYRLFGEFFILLGYMRLTVPFTWPFHLWEKIKYRFPDFNVIEIKCPYYRNSKKYFNFSPNSIPQELILKFIDEPLETREYFVNQIQLLYHVFKYFKKDILLE